MEAKRDGTVLEAIELGRKIIRRWFEIGRKPFRREDLEDSLGTLGRFADSVVSSLLDDDLITDGPPEIPLALLVGRSEPVDPSLGVATYRIRQSVLSFPELSPEPQGAGGRWTDYMQVKVLRDEKMFNLSQSGWTDFAKKLQREGLLRVKEGSGNKQVQVHESAFKAKGIEFPE